MRSKKLRAVQELDTEIAMAGVSSCRLEPGCEVAGVRPIETKDHALRVRVHQSEYWTGMAVILSRLAKFRKIQFSVQRARSRVHKNSGGGGGAFGARSSSSMQISERGSVKSEDLSLSIVYPKPRVLSPEYGCRLKWGLNPELETIPAFISSREMGHLPTRMPMRRVAALILRGRKWFIF